MPLDREEVVTPDTYGTTWTKDNVPKFYRGSEDRVAKLRNHLRKSSKRSFVLIGDSGTGKTAILHSLFHELVRSDWLVIETSTTEIIRGATYVGEWQTRVADLMDVGKFVENRLIFIKDIHNLRGAGSGSNSKSDMAEAITPFIEREDVVVIGECTEEAYRRGVEACPGLKNQITAFRLEPLKPGQAEEYVRYAFEELKESFKEDVGVDLSLSDTMAKSLEQMGKIYFAGTAQPGAAIGLLRATVEGLREKLENEETKSGNVEVTHRDVISTVNRISGLPMHLLDDNVPLDLKKTREFFDSRLVGQNEAITTVTDVITLIKAGLTDPGKPTAVMLFAGPTGVGKTELAKALAEFLFGASDRMIRCDMSEYKDYNSFEKFIGRPNDAEDPGSLINRVRRQPFSVVLLDEVEKANPNIFDVLLQAFDDGRLTDPNGNTTDLTQTIIVMTSNLGSDLSRPKPVGFDSAAPEAEELVDKALRGFFRPEFLNRIDHIVRFHPLQREHIRTLAKRELGKALMRSGLIRRELRVSVEPAVHDVLASKGYDERYGARPLRRQVEKLAVLPVAKKIISLGEQDRGSLLRLFIAAGKIEVELVEDRQTRTARRMVQGIRVVDPIDGKNTKVKWDDVETDLVSLGRTVEALQARSKEESFRTKKAEFVSESAEEDFWDDQSRAREVLGEIYRLERLIGAIGIVEGSFEKLVGRADYLRSNPSESAMRQLALDLRSAQRYAGLVRYAVECRSDEDRRDAFVLVRLGGSIAEKDLVFDLVECYRQWAVRNDYEFRIVHEESEDDSVLKEVVFELSGPAACGIFQAEEGEHEFVFGKSGRNPKTSHFLSVRILGTALGDPLQDVSIRKKAIKRSSRFGDPIYSQVSATDRVSGRTIEISSPLQGEELEDSATRLLAAEIEHGQDGKTEIVRRYRMSPGLSVEDLREVEVEVNGRDFWKGEIDEILLSGILSRQIRDGELEGVAQ